MLPVTQAAHIQHDTEKNVPN